MGNGRVEGAPVPRRKQPELESMKTIAAIVNNLFEDSEFIEPTEALKKAGHRVVTVGIREGEMVWGKTDNSPVKIDRAVESVTADEFDGLLIPGGYSPDKLRVFDEAVGFVRAFVLSGKPVFVICHGPQLLITARVLEGRRVTGYTSIVQDIKNAGAEYVDAEVVVDGNLVSSRTPADLPAFINAMLDALG
jgi:protease I